MGIVNATPDSFYDGNPQNNLPALLAKCREYAAGGADIFDIGGESTRPNAAPVPAEEEIRRASLALPQRQREMIYLRQYLSFKEIAELMDRPLGTVLADCHRAIKKMQHLLAAKQTAAREVNL